MFIHKNKQLTLLWRFFFYYCWTQKVPYDVQISTGTRSETARAQARLSSRTKCPSPKAPRARYRQRLRRPRMGSYVSPVESGTHGAGKSSSERIRFYHSTDKLSTPGRCDIINAPIVEIVNVANLHGVKAFVTYYRYDYYKLARSKGRLRLRSVPPKRHENTLLTNSALSLHELAGRIGRCFAGRVPITIVCRRKVCRDDDISSGNFFGDGGSGSGKPPNR